ncbi:hypothetical protein J25TS5_02070 [Paenibacillus faecis]|uniref:DUF1835 domain-containing protein n=1 Tax=Paenibacillus faecis TaxID=862114 RepID=UPI001B259206|nr:DUF1835 domain-containing protein [Paenibacillus faecis]GIO83275.1 hypothetical protein J25TS5_02070 [Paenibacillus faecis]
MDEMTAIRKAVEGLRGDELKAYLRFLLAQISLLDKKESQPSAIAELIELYDNVVSASNRREAGKISPDDTHVHIVVGHSFAGSIKQALRQIGWSETHKVIVLEEDYAIGPLGDLDLPKGRQARIDWFRDHISGGAEAYSSFEEEYEELLRQVAQISERAEVVIWAAGNACEQMGMRHALHLLSNKSNDIAVYNACTICEEMYNRPDAWIKYRHSGEIVPDKLCDALARMDGSGMLVPADIERLRQEWQALSEQANVLRIWRDGAVVEVPADSYDQYLLEKLDLLQSRAGNDGFLRAARLISEAMGHCDQTIGDDYFEYRLRTLIYDGVLEIKGVPAAMRYYSVRRKTSLG